MIVLAVIGAIVLGVGYGMYRRTRDGGGGGGEPRLRNAPGTARFDRLPPRGGQR